MNTYWLLGKEGSCLSPHEDNFLPTETTPDLLQIISEH